MKKKPAHKKTDVAAITSLLVRLDRILAGTKADLLPNIRKLAREVDQLVPYYDGHMVRVTFFSLAIGLKMELSREDLLTLEVAALLHDFGKLGVDEYTLEKEDKLSDDEMTEIHHHAERGFHILSGFAKLERAAVIIRDHHEKYDGSGYPGHKRGPDISLLARIIAVADAYDAMTADRPYRKGLSQKLAEAELLAHAGKQFDPLVVDYFVNHIKDKTPKPKRRKRRGSVSSGKNQFTDCLPVFYNYY